MAHPATLNISSWELKALNPDGTDNTIISPLLGTVSTSEVCKFAAMGQKLALVLECVMAGHYDTGGSIDATVEGTTVRFNPALFAEAFSTYPFTGTFPSAGYSAVIPNTTPAIYPMALTFPNGQFTNSNENGSCSIQVISSTEFTITYEFRMTFDVLGYLTGRSAENRFRLTKNSTANSEQLDNTFTSVYDTTKALNAYVATKQLGYVLNAPELSIQFQASFNSVDSNGDALFPFEVIYRDLDNPSGSVPSIISFKDTEVTFEFEDPDELIIEDEAVVILTNRILESNVAGYEKDLQIKEVKLVTTGSSATIDGLFKGPVSYSKSGGITSVTFTLDHTQLTYNNPYDLHILTPYNNTPSTVETIHGATQTQTDQDSALLNFTMTSEFYSRNGNHAESFTATVMERVANVLTINKTQFNSEASPPYSNFFADIQTVTFELQSIFGVTIFQGGILKNSNDNTFTNTSLIEVVEDGDLVHFICKPFRIPYLNEQNLPNLGINEEDVYNFTWKVRFIASNDELFQSEYVNTNVLTIRPYENNTDVPSGAPKVNDIKFLDPNTGFPIGAWCDYEEILVQASIADLGEDTFVQVFVDKFPYGVTFTNDIALEEEDPAEHNDELPTYLSFEQKTSDLVSLLEANPEDGIISFRLDVSELQGEEKYRISIFAYRANPIP